jgi:hypothetical protein
MRSGAGGQFSFALPEGLYLLTATRDSYFPAAYGARRPSGRAIPIRVTRESSAFTELRMRRRGGLTGHVYDENGVPMAGIPVIAYRARLPLRAAATAASDDRGVYRIGGLEPGRYWVRSAAQRLGDESSWLPTFGPVTREASQARVQSVLIENDTAFADIHPEQGALFSLSGALGCIGDAPVTVTVSSEAGQHQVSGVCGGGYRIDGLAPAAYEITATQGGGAMSGFTEVFLDRDSTSGSLQLQPAPQIAVDFSIGNAFPRVNLNVRVYGRRQSLANTEPGVDLRNLQSAIVPGYWEFRAEPPDGYYVESIQAPSALFRERGAKPVRPTDAFDGFIPARQATRIRVVLSDRPGRISGQVRADQTASGKATAERPPVPGAPVFLVPVTSAARRGLGGPKQTLTDTEGRYRFDNLPPGDYRLAASFDILDIDEELPEVLTASSAHVTAGQPSTADLTLWLPPLF